MTPEKNTEDLGQYARAVADGSHDWYNTYAVRSRRLYKASESAIIAISAAVPVSAVVAPGNSIVPGVLGAVIVALSGLRGIFHWHDNYLRFSEAREAVEAQRRLYTTSAAPYEDLRTKDGLLVDAVTRIEQAEMRNWVKVASRRQQAQEANNQEDTSA